MTAQSSDRPNVELLGAAPSVFNYGTPCSGSGAGTQFYQGQMLMVTGSGLLLPARAVTAADAPQAGVVVVGVNRHTAIAVSNTNPLPEQGFGMQYELGCFAMANAAQNGVTAATPPGTLLFAVDDQTVGTSQLSSTLPVAGRLIKYTGTADAYPVWVAIGGVNSVSGSTI